MPHAPTSLRTVALASNVTGITEAEPSNPVPPAQEDGDSTSDNNNNAAPSDSPLPAPASSEDEDLSDVNDDASLLNDDLQLQSQEYIVPVPIEGRQAQIYSDELANNQDVLKKFVEHPQEQYQIAEVERILKRIRAIETHVDLIYPETLASQGFGSTQTHHQAQWSNDNSIKFKFVGTLLQKLREINQHIVIVIKGYDDRLFALIETYLRAKHFNYDSPDRGKAADARYVDGSLLVTVLSSESSRVIRPPDLIVCLNGALSAEKIRKQGWALNPVLPTVPLLHLVIPRTIDHLERYTSKSLDRKTRIHTLFASLAQLHTQGEIGQAMYPHTPGPDEAVEEIIEFMSSLQESGEGAVEWPLPSIGSIKDVIEFQSQESQQSMAPVPPGTAAGKRPLVSVHDVWTGHKLTRKRRSLCMSL
jgi:hypothetical protein